VDHIPTARYILLPYGKLVSHARKEPSARHYSAPLQYLYIFSPIMHNPFHFCSVYAII